MRTKVIDAARRLGLDPKLRTLQQPTRSIAEAAAAVGCDAERIAKSIVFLADGEPIVCVASGGRRIDPERVCEVVDCAYARMASPDEVRAATGFSPGGVPPLGHGLPVVLDEALLEHDTVWASGGDGSCVFEVDPRELVERLGARVAPLGA
jgi:prolyl-tRNA editing enzyme YbaK/EbsC (Cys-tRNA(Pro) deacylase)